MTNNKNEVSANEKLDLAIADAKEQKKEINDNLFKKEYIVTIFQTGDKTMSCGIWDKQVSPRRSFQVASLNDLPDIINKMQIGFWQHPDLKEDLSNAKKIEFDEKQWGIYHNITIEPLTEELEKQYLNKSKQGFFEHHRDFLSREERESA